MDNELHCGSDIEASSELECPIPRLGKWKDVSRREDSHLSSRLARFFARATTLIVFSFGIWRSKFRRAGTLSLDISPARTRYVLGTGSVLNFSHP